MRALRRLWLAAALAAAALAGCSSAPPRQPSPPLLPPPASQSLPDGVPRVEPKSRYGNPPFYEVFGKRYYVLASSADYVERGVASWYGPGFHKERTSTGEPYDMYGMTAAHKTLPLPAYVSVTNLQNGRNVVVRINDRGPFVDNRIIDLSYTAAARLDMLRDGTAIVEVRAIDPAANAPQPAGSYAALFVQAGAFADSANAERLAAKLRAGGYGNVFIRDDTVVGRRMFRVRIGPVPDVPELDRIVEALDHAGVHDAHLAMD